MHQQPWVSNKILAKAKVLVTGGAGFIGSHIAQYLLNHGAAMVRVLDNMSNGRLENIAILKQYPNFEFIEGDVRNMETCQLVASGITHITHQAALGSVPRSIANPTDSVSTNVTGTVNILQAAVLNNIRRVVFASSSSVYGDDDHLPKIENIIGKPLSPYPASKAGAEEFAAVFAKIHPGLQTIGLRYFNVFGPRQSPNGDYAAVIPKFIAAMLRGETVTIYGDGSYSRDFTYVENAVQGNIRALFTNNENAYNQIFNVAAGGRFSLIELHRALQQLTKNPKPPEFAKNRPGDVPHSMANIEKAKLLLDFNPEVHFYEGLQKTVASF